MDSLNPRTIALAALVLAIYVRQHLTARRRAAAWAFSAWRWLPGSERRRLRLPKPALVLRAAAALALVPLAEGAVWDAATPSQADAVMLVLDASSSMSARRALVLPAPTRRAS